VKGALVMVLARQSDSQPVYVPNSAGSMFFMCLSDIPAYDYNKFTVFGQVTAGLEVLDQLEENDVIESVEITKKKDRPYTVNKIPAP
jgi:cyclophilin family peptidyl-prolyl cis-trans isomerase